MTGEVEEAVWRRPVALPMVDYMGNWRSRWSRGGVQPASWARAGQRRAGAGEGRVGKGRAGEADGLAVKNIRPGPTCKADSYVFW